MFAPSEFAHHKESIGFRLIPEVKPCCAGLVLGWEIPVVVGFSFLFFFSYEISNFSGPSIFLSRLFWLASTLYVSLSGLGRASPKGSHASPWNPHSKWTRQPGSRSTSKDKEYMHALYFVRYIYCLFVKKKRTEKNLVPLFLVPPFRVPPFHGLLWTAKQIRSVTDLLQICCRSAGFVRGVSCIEGMVTMQ